MSILLMARARINHQAHVGHRYWRVYITANGGGPTNDIEPGSGFRTAPGGAFVSVFSAAASSLYTGNSAINAWNGTTGWQSATGAVPAWNAVDLGMARSIIEVAIKGPSSTYVNRSPRDCTIQYSDGGLSGPWTDVISFAGLTWGNAELKTLSLV